MFNKEQLEALIITLKENISLAESLLKTKKYEDAEAVKSMIASQQKTLEDYTERLENIKVGRPSIGSTKKISLTLQEHEWEWVDKKAEGNRSQYFREVVRSEMKEELIKDYEDHLKTFEGDDIEESDCCPKCGSEVKIVHEVEALGLDIYDVPPWERDKDEEEVTHIECGGCGTKYVNISY